MEPSSIARFPHSNPLEIPDQEPETQAEVVFNQTHYNITNLMHSLSREDIETKLLGLSRKIQNFITQHPFDVAKIALLGFTAYYLRPLLLPVAVLTVLLPVKNHSENISSHLDEKVN